MKNCSFFDIASPKRTTTKKTDSRETWYDFYAMYAAEFVRGVFDRLSLPAEASVLDPWNGTGTTTLISRERNFRAAGVDANPAMSVIALGRLFMPAESLFEKIVENLRSHENGLLVDGDPLLKWFIPSAAEAIRKIELATCLATGSPLIRSSSISMAKSQAAFCYVALFRCVRRLISPFRGSNPTWVKEPATAANRLRPAGPMIFEYFKEEYDLLVAIAKTYQNPDERTQFPKIVVGNSAKLPFENDRFDLTLTSPPYCTRIDYIKATSPELAVLNYSDEDIRKLREGMLGTPVIAKEVLEEPFSLGVVTDSLLDSIKSHTSEASASYYHKTYAQYFRSLAKSIEEITRVSRKGAKAVFVVQDSYYKDIHIDLETIYTEFLVHNGWTLGEVMRFDTTTMAAIHMHRRKYRDSADATESVLVFQKEK